MRQAIPRLRLSIVALLLIANMGSVLYLACMATAAGMLGLLAVGDLLSVATLVGSVVVTVAVLWLTARGIRAVDANRAMDRPTTIGLIVTSAPVYVLALYGHFFMRGGT